MPNLRCDNIKSKLCIQIIRLILLRTNPNKIRYQLILSLTVSNNTHKRLSQDISSVKGNCVSQLFSICISRVDTALKDELIH